MRAAHTILATTMVAHASSVIASSGRISTTRVHAPSIHADADDWPGTCIALSDCSVEDPGEFDRASCQRRDAIFRTDRQWVASGSQLPSSSSAD